MRVILRWIVGCLFINHPSHAEEGDIDSSATVELKLIE